MINIAVVDDHSLLRQGVSMVVERFGYTILIQAANGKEFINQLNAANLPRVVLLDTDMPVMNGFKTAEWLKQNYPAIKVIAFSMRNDEDSIYSMLKNGAKAFLAKDSTPFEIKEAIAAVIHKGHYYSNLLVHRGYFSSNTLNEDNTLKYTVLLSDREMEFLKHVCTELTYKEIAAKMFVSPRTVDNYRESLFEKLDIKSRTGLCIYAIKRGIVEL